MASAACPRAEHNLIRYRDAGPGLHELARSKFPRVHAVAALKSEPNGLPMRVLRGCSEASSRAASTSTAGSNVTLKTNGVGFQVISTKGPDRGNAEVWIDGTRRATINLYAAGQQPAQVVYTVEGLANATHQVELRALGSRTAPSTANRVDIDGFIALR